MHAAVVRAVILDRDLLDQVTIGDEKAGFGGSTPSPATILFKTLAIPIASLKVRWSV